MLGAVHAFDPSDWEAKADKDISTFEASLTYRVTSRTAGAISKHPPQNKTKQQANKQNKKTPKIVTVTNKSKAPLYYNCFPST